MEIKVLQISTALSWRGGEQQLAYLIEELKGKVDVFVLCSKDSAMENFCKNTNIPHLSIPKKGGVNFHAAKTIARLCKSNDYTCLHTHDAHAHTHAFLSALIFGNKTPLIVSRRVDFPIQKNWFSSLKYNHSAVKKILCVSEAIREITALGIKDSNKLEVVYSGIDTTKFREPCGKLRNELGIHEDNFLVGNTSALADHKDYFTFLKVAEAVIQKNSKAHFVIMGVGPLENELKSFCRRLSHHQQIHFMGFRNDIPEVLSELDVFLITSKTEGLGTSVLDALAARVPIVGTKAGGIPEIIEHSQNGLLSSVGDVDALVQAVLKLHMDEALREKLILNGADKVKAFSKTNMAINTLKHYRDLK